MTAQKAALQARVDENPQRNTGLGLLASSCASPYCEGLNPMPYGDALSMELVLTISYYLLCSNIEFTESA